MLWTGGRRRRRKRNQRERKKRRRTMEKERTADELWSDMSERREGRSEKRLKRKKME